ncbi:MAG: transporter substrate-binding domain-containing protein [Ruminococcus sp.]|nr:transporter substrate-binding domain-containing protein [Ruminococcus sp.]
MKKVLALVMVCVFATLMLVGCGSSNKTDWDYIKDKGEMVIGMTLFEPMNFKDANGEMTGFETEFAQAVCEELGVKAKFQEINWDSKEVELKSKTIDCIWNGMTITDERKQNMSISTPYMENKQVMVVKKDKVEQYATAEGVKGASVIAEAGSAGEEVAQGDEFFKEAKYVSGKSQAMSLMEVKAGTSDIAIIDFIMAKGSIRPDSDYSDLAIIESKSFAPEQYGAAFRKDSNTTEKVNEAMQKVADSGKLKEIADKYNLTDMLLLKAK